MSENKEYLVKFLNFERKNSIEYPIVLRRQWSIRNNSKNDSLRRNTPSYPSPRKHEPRLITKRGRVKVYFRKIPQKSLKYASDLWNTLVNMQWRWLSMIVVLVNLLAYGICGLLFYMDDWASRDDDNKSCMVGTTNAVGFFQIGIETITTTGYGYLHPTEYCRFYWVVLTFSTLTSILIDGIFISVVYAKLNKPKDSDSYGWIFSKKAAICLRNKRLNLIVRVNDRDGKHWIDTSIRMYLICETSSDGETLSNYITELQIKPFGMLFCPIEVIHEISPTSPLWTISAKELMTSKLEIIVVVTGCSVKTGQTTRTQTSYLGREIMWGYQFTPCMNVDSQKKELRVNKALFHQTVKQEMPLCNAEELDRIQRHIENVNVQINGF